MQISADGLKAYPDAVEIAFGSNVDFAQIIKECGKNPGEPEARYSPAKCLSSGPLPSRDGRRPRAGSQPAPSVRSCRPVDSSPKARSACPVVAFAERDPAPLSVATNLPKVIRHAWRSAQARATVPPPETAPQHADPSPPVRAENTKTAVQRI